VGTYWHVCANDDNLRFALFDELKLFTPQGDIPWCLGRDFNVLRSPYERSWNFLTLSILVVSLTL